MKKPKLNRDYALVKAYKCWHCDFYSGFEAIMSDHIEKEHPETLR